MPRRQLAPIALGALLALTTHCRRTPPARAPELRPLASPTDAPTPSRAPEPDVALLAQPATDAAPPAPVVRWTATPRVRDPVATAPPPADAEPPPGPTLARVFSLDGGAALVYALPGTRAIETFDVIVRALDPDGVPTGPSYRAARVRGRAVSLAADGRGGTAWIAYRAERGREYLVQTVALRSAFAEASPPITLEGGRYGEGESEVPGIQLRATDDGGAFVMFADTRYQMTDRQLERAMRSLAASGVGGAPGGNPEERWTFARLLPDHTVPPMVGFEATIVDDGGSESAHTPGALTLTPAGALAGVFDLNARATLRSLGDSGGASPVRELSTTGPNVVLARAGERVLVLSIMDPSPQGQRAGAVSEARFVAGDGGAPTLGSVARERVLQSIEVRCARGRAMVRVAWDGGSVDLHPTAPDASVPLDQLIGEHTLPESFAGSYAWAGRVLVGLPEEGFQRVEDTTPDRWVCASPDGVLVRADAPRGAGAAAAGIDGGAAGTGAGASR